MLKPVHIGLMDICQSTHVKAVFNACLASRSRVLGLDSKIDPRNIVAYCSDQAHSSAARAAAMSLMQIRNRFFKKVKILSFMERTSITIEIGSHICGEHCTKMPRLLHLSLLWNL